MKTCGNLICMPKRILVFQSLGAQQGPVNKKVTSKKLLLIYIWFSKIV